MQSFNQIQTVQTQFDALHVGDHHQLRVHYQESTSKYTFLFQEGQVECSDAELQRLSVALHAEIQLKIKVAVCLDIPLIISCVKEELKCFANITFQAFLAVVHCIKLAILHGFEKCAAFIETFLDECCHLGYHVLVEITAACEWLKLKFISGICQIKLALYWSGAKLREICHSLKVEVNMKWKELKCAYRQAKLYLRYACRKVTEKLEACLKWIKHVFHTLKDLIKVKLHHFGECVMSHIHQACLKVILPCFEPEIVAKVSLCNSYANNICLDNMFEKLVICPDLWKGAKKTNCDNISEKLITKYRIAHHVKRVDFRFCGLDYFGRMQMNIVTTTFLKQAIANKECAFNPSLVCFKDATISQEWLSYLRVSSVQHIEARNSTAQGHVALDGKTFTSFSITLEELKSTEFNPFLHKELSSLTIRIKVQASLFAYNHDANALLRKRRVVNLNQAELYHSPISVMVQEKHQEVMMLQSVQTLCGLHLKTVIYEFVEKTTKKTIRVSCPVVRSC